ncbi:MAG: NRDE family protein [Syntrophales bacterium]|nr:NRDE family protein [Syntrophales bacterium]MCK9528371.1 NRDE family protein [Syntrophales bacterium]MDX9922704.1 NRDE family protein [Syntrophales bacterium]
MCLIIFAYRLHSEYPLIIAANRDEFYDRPTAAASFWKDAPEVLGGRDLRGGGTWMGIERGGRLAALTNYRDPRFMKDGAPSRGMLVSSFLTGGDEPVSFLRRVNETAEDYSGFTLLLGSPESLWWYSNAGGGITSVKPGIHGLSNHLMDTPWPKVERGKQLLKELLSGEGSPSPEGILDILEDSHHPPDHLLPDTGVGIEWERMLSPLFITSSSYGTFSSTVLLVNKKREVLFVEKDQRPGPSQGTVARFEFPLGGGSNERQS